MSDNRLFLPRPVGFEIEFGSSAPSPLSRLERILCDAGYEVKNYGGWRRTERNNYYWDLKTDSSCGFEAASPTITTHQDLLRHSKVVDLVKKVGTIDANCGLHVHVQLNDLEREQCDRLIRFLTRYQEAFFLLAPSHRRENRWCKKLNEDHYRRLKSAAGSLDSIYKAFREDKNVWINGQPLARTGTLEFRLMGGDITPEFVFGWVSLIQQVFKHTTFGKKSVSWGKAKARDNRMLLFTMLQQAGCYGKDLATCSEHDKKMATDARGWAIAQFNSINPTVKETQLPEGLVREEEAEDDLVESTF